MQNGQATIETFGAVLLLMVLFVASVWLFSQINASATQVAAQTSDWVECLRMASLLQEVFVQGPGIRLVVDVDRDFKVSHHSIYFQNATCEFTALVSPNALSVGRVMLTNDNGIVVLENA